MTYNMKAKFYNVYLKKLKILGVVCACAALILLLSFVSFSVFVNVTTVFCDGAIETVYTLSESTEEILEKSGFTVGKKDRVIEEQIKGVGNVIYIAKEHNVTIYDGNKLVSKMKFTGTVEEVLKKAKVKLKKGDEMNFLPEQGITDDICIKVRRGFKVKVTADGKTKTLLFAGGTMEDLLKKAGLEFDSDDYMSPKRGTKIEKSVNAVLKRVEYEYETVKSAVEYETEVEYDGSMYEDEVKVKVKGKNGKKTETLRKMYIDGEYTKTEVVETVITKKPVTKVVIRGSKARPGGYLGGYVSSRRVISELSPPFKIELDENNRPTKYEKIITGKATAYCTGTTCSTGVRAMPGRVAVDPREIPYGTKMYIVSSDGRWHYGYATASDTGGFIYNSSTVVDLYMRSYSDCVSFGRRNVDIYILEWG